MLSTAVFLGRPFLGALGLSDVSLQIGGAVVLAFSGRLFALLGERVTLAFVRLMGLVLAAIAVELMLRSIRTFMETL